MKRIGILGGSFNPAHEGHRHISIRALHELKLDEVWWMVAPQNPLKPRGGMAPFASRLKEARRLARHRRIKVTGIEKKLGTFWTADTLKELKVRRPEIRFVWLMGADNLIEIPRWRNWTAIFEAVPIAVFARPSYSLRALKARAARRFKERRIRRQEAGTLAELPPPAWVFIPGRDRPVGQRDPPAPGEAASEGVGGRGRKPGA
jgi:Nicotinic acid mononucleotide adenylyltransferase